MTMEELLHKKRILAQMAHLFFEYHNIGLTFFESNNYELIIQTNKAIPQELRNVFLNKFELTHMELELVKHDHVSGDVCYIFKRPLSPEEQKIKLWIDSSLPIQDIGPICHIPPKK